MAAQHYAYLLDAMHQYRDGRRDAAVMRAALGPLSEAQMKALAHWFAAQSPAQQKTHEAR
jgi:cytochrome c553